MKRRIKVGSRESALALSQTEWVVNEIKKRYADVSFEIVKIKTKGDIILDKKLDKIGGKGLFIKELEQALLDGTVDLAVHSMKDMPAEMPEELVIAAFSQREDPRDVLVTPDCKRLSDLEEGAVVGTSSARREAQLLARRPDLRIKTLRGNVLTRLNKLAEREYDALVLAAAGLKRLGMEEKCVRYFDVDTMVPAVGQGVLCIQTRKDGEVRRWVECLNDTQAALCVAAERAFMCRLNGGCSTPIAAHAVIDGDRMKVWGMLASEDLRRVYKETAEGAKQDAEALGRELVERILRNKMEMEKKSFQ